MNKIFIDLKNSFVKIFKNPIYSGITFFVTVILFLLTIYLVNNEFISYIISTNLFSGYEKVKLILSTWRSIYTAIPLYNIFLLLITGILAGINISYFIYYVKRRVIKQRGSGVSILGIIIGFFGIGCSACGSVLLSSLIGLTASSQILGFLPFKGIEFSVIGLALIIGSTLFIAKKIEDPQVCPIKINNK